VVAPSLGCPEVRASFVSDADSKPLRVPLRGHEAFHTEAKVNRAPNQCAEYVALRENDGFFYCHHVDFTFSISGQVLSGKRESELDCWVLVITFTSV
jgi:membrane carboxypeptidase/penicillin-binding protein PbpC